MQRKLIVSLVLVFLLSLCGLVAWLILTNPDNFIVRLARSPITQQIGNAKVITGPFPLKNDFDVLRSSGVTTIISLLNPAIPYEKSLLDQEIKMAEKYKIQLLSFPMSSILGQQFGTNYQSNAEAAAEAIAKAPGRVYIHCYLGLHRSMAVVDILKNKNLNIKQYSFREAERSEDALISDEIDLAFANSNYSRVLELIPDQESIPFDKAMLRNWSLYRIRKFAEAKAGFVSLLIKNPEQTEAILGSAYSSMQLQDLTSAEGLFTRATSLAPDNSDAWAGLGLIHFRSGDTSKALIELQQAVELNPSNTEAAEALAKLKPKP